MGSEADKSVEECKTLASERAEALKREHQPSEDEVSPIKKIRCTEGKHGDVKKIDLSKTVFGQPGAGIFTFRQNYFPFDFSKFGYSGNESKKKEENGIDNNENSQQLQKSNVDDGGSSYIAWLLSIFRLPFNALMRIFSRSTHSPQH